MSPLHPPYGQPQKSREAMGGKQANAGQGVAGCLGRGEDSCTVRVQRGVGWAVRAALYHCQSPLCPVLGWSQGLRRPWLWVWLPGYSTAMPKHPWKACFPGTPPTRAGAEGPSLIMDVQTVLNKLSPASSTDRDMWAAQLHQEV